VTSPLPERRLVDAAHILHRCDEQLGQPVISNGRPLTKIHAHLIGFEPDFRVHVSERLLDVIGGSLSKIC
jgi:putative restriction endonuclease